MRNASRLVVLGLLAAAGWCASAGSANMALAADKKKQGDEPLKPIAIAAVKHNGPVSFEQDIRPILSKKCLACHNTTTHESQLILESPAAILKGGESGPAAVAKKSADSLLLKVASHQVEPIMPPADNDVGAAALTPEELGLLKLWIDEGAVAGAAAAAAAVKWQPLPPGINPIYAVAMTDDGQWAACGRANQIFLYHLPSGRTVTRMTDPALVKAGRAAGTAHLDLVHSLAFSPDGNLLASGGFREIKLWRRPQQTHKFDLAGIPEPITAMATSPDGKLLATGLANGVIKVWDAATGKETKTLSGHTGAVKALQFLRNSPQLASGSADKTVRLWKLEDGSVVAQKELPQPVAAIAVTSDDQQLAAGGGDKTIHVWKLGTEDVRKIEAAAAPVTALVAAPDKPQRLFSGHADKTIGEWTLAGDKNDKQVRQLDHGGVVTALAVRGDGVQLASAGENNIIKLWKIENGAAWMGVNNQPIPIMTTGDLRAQLNQAVHERLVARATAKAEAAKQAVTAAEALVKTSAEAITTTAKAKEAAAKTLMEKKAAEKAPADAKAAADKELEVAMTAKTDTEKKATETKEAAEKDANNADLAKARDEARKAADAAAAKFTELEKKAKDATTAATKAQQETLSAESANAAADQAATGAVTANQKAIEAVPVAQAAQKATADAQTAAQAVLETAKTAAKAQEQPVRTLVYSPDNKLLAAGGDNKLVTTWNAEVGAPAETFPLPAAAAAVAYGADGTLITAADKTGIAWSNDQPWALERTIGSVDNPQLLDDRILALAFSPDGKTLASGGGEPSRSGELKLWNLADGKLVRAISPSHSDTIFSAEFAPDGSQIASAGADRMMKVFDVTSGALQRTYEGHTHHVLGVSWRSDGKLLASSGADNAVKMWDVATGEQPRPAHATPKEATALRFVGLTTKVLVASGDKVLRLMETNPGGGAEKTYSGATDYIYSLAVSGDGKLVLGGGQDSTLRLWNVDTATLIRDFPAPAVESASMAKQ